jgi:hypothetical protein
VHYGITKSMTYFICVHMFLNQTGEPLQVVGYNYTSLRTPNVMRNYARACCPNEMDKFNMQSFDITFTLFDACFWNPFQFKHAMYACETGTCEVVFM